VDQNEIGVLIPGDGTQEVSNHRDIVLCHQGGARQRISHLHKSYSCLHYMLLFPTGENGFFPSIPSYPGPNREIRSDCVSERCYYAYRLHIRNVGNLREQPALFMGSKLLQQYTVDAWASIQQNLLNWTRFNQKKIWADVYQGLHDAVVGDRDNNINLAEYGQCIILPSSFIGSECHMQQLFQDSIAICRSFHKPDIFLQ